MEVFICNRLHEHRSEIAKKACEIVNEGLPEREFCSVNSHKTHAKGLYCICKDETKKNLTVSESINENPITISCA